LKTFRKVLFYAALTAGVLLIALLISVFLYKDRIINQFVHEANKHLNTPVKIGKMDVSMFEKFPQLSIVLTDVYVEDSHEGKYPLLTAKTISFQLNPVEVWKGVYIIKGLQITDSETNLKINAKGKSNYVVLKEERESEGSGAISLELKNVALVKTRVRYVDVSINEELIFTSQDLQASIQSSSNIFDIHAQGDLTTEKIDVNGNSYLAGKQFAINSDLVYDDPLRKLTIKPSSLKLKNSGFQVDGTYAWKEDNLIDLHVDGDNTDIQTLLSLLPESTSKAFEKYQSQGDVYFKANLKGEISQKKSPALSIDFGFTDATLFHPDYKSRIEGASMNGSFASQEVTDLSVAALILKDVSGSLNNEPFTANFILQNFNNPEVILDFKGRIDAASVLGFYPIENIAEVSGTLLADVSFNGKIELLKKKATAQRVSTLGTIDLQHINFIYGKNKIPVQNLNGNLQFSNNDLALSNVSGKLGNSDFLLNGFFKNVITFLLFENQPIGIETDLKSNYLDLNQLFTIGFSEPSEGPTQHYAFSISRNINLNFNCDIKAMRYKRFHANNLQGDLLVKNEMAVSRNINLESMGGTMNFSGIVDAKNPKAIDVVSSFKLNGIHVDSIFYVFENFDQHFIEDKHLRGQANADVSLEMVLKPNLSLFPETLIADISAVIKNGELNNFEPMQKLKKYLNDDGLSKLRFSDLKNDIHIENKTIYIPQMEVRTNVTSLKVSGTHTFDQQIDYHIVTPLRKTKPTDFDAQAAMEEDGSGQTYLYLKITGTTDDYKVSYDTEAAKKKIVKELKNEVQELKDAFKNKGTQKKKELELEKDEYFEWDR